MKREKKALVLFAKAPLDGRCKKRLIPAPGVAGATALHRGLL